MALQGKEDHEAIVVNGHQIFIRRNLFAFFESFRKRNDNSPIWVDQVSINQEDLSERSVQVAMMHRIYISAIETFLWLGDDPEQALGLLVLQKAVGATNLRQIGHFIECVSTPEKRAAIRNLFMASYWERHWIIQEVVLSANPIVLLNGIELPLETLVSAHRFYDFDKDQPLGISESYLPLSGLCSVIVAISDSAQIKITDEEAWYRLMQAVAVSRCGDPRDKIYGIQGLLKAEWRVKVDYSRPYKDVYLEAIELYSTFLTNKDFNEFYWGCRCLAVGMDMADMQNGWITFERDIKTEGRSTSENDLIDIIKQQIIDFIFNRETTTGMQHLPRVQWE
jgi:hypothetical protein